MSRKIGIGLSFCKSTKEPHMLKICRNLCLLACFAVACWKRNTLRWFPVRLVKTTIKSRHHIKGCKQRSKNWKLLAGRERAKYVSTFSVKKRPLSLLYICESKICLKFSVFMRRNEELTPIPILVLSYTFQSHQKLCEQECLLE